MAGEDTSQGKAFVMGGAGCLLAFLGFAALAVATGGTAYLDLGGVVFLIIIGGIVGLIVNAIYQRGRRDARDDPPDSPRGPIEPE